MVITIVFISRSTFDSVWCTIVLYKQDKPSSEIRLEDVFVCVMNNVISHTAQAYISRNTQIIEINYKTICFNF